jgi:hypothetical protein
VAPATWVRNRVASRLAAWATTMAFFAASCDGRHQARLTRDTTQVKHIFSESRGALASRSEGQESFDRARMALERHPSRQRRSRHR